MRTVDITIEDASFDELDAISRAAGLTLAEFIRRAAAAAIRLYKVRDAARRDTVGYTAASVGDEEFAIDPDDLNRADDDAWLDSLVHVRATR